MFLLLQFAYIQANQETDENLINLFRFWMHFEMDMRLEKNLPTKIDQKKQFKFNILNCNRIRIRWLAFCCLF